MWTESGLLEYGRNTLVTESLQKSFAKYASSRESDVFLSHCHGDTRLVSAAAKWLQDLGLTAYIDWCDPEMPAFTSEVTARRIRRKIVDAKWFIMLATNRAIASRWVPWELGLADGYLGAGRVILFPVSDLQNGWTGSEYLDLYPAIWETKGGGWRIFPAGKDTGGVLAKSLPRRSTPIR